MMLFFFSSRRRHTRWNCDWSSDVCSSDLGGHLARVNAKGTEETTEYVANARRAIRGVPVQVSEQRAVQVVTADRVGPGHGQGRLAYPRLPGDQDEATLAGGVQVLQVACAPGEPNRWRQLVWW